MLQGLVQRPGIADGEDLVGVSPRGQPIRFLLIPRGELDLGRRLDAGADDLAVALRGMDIAEEEQRAGREDGKHTSTPARKPR